MTISTTTSSVILNADGSTHEFTFNFKILAATDLTVIVRSTSGTETVKTLNSHYIVPTTSVGAANGGTILFKFNTGNTNDAHYSASDNRPANGEKVIIRRSPALDQSLDLVDNDPFSAELIETSLDKITMQVQSLQEEVDRSFRLSRTNLLDKDGSQIDNTFFQLSEDVASRKGKFLQFNSTTGVIEPSATSDDVTTLAAVTTDIALLADIQDGTSATNTLTVVSGISGNVTTCASISSDITSVAGISSNVTTVAGKASLITSSFATDMSLVTSDFVADMSLVTADFISDLNLITSDFISDMSLVTADFVSDLNLITSDVITDMNLLATSANVTAMANLGTSTNVTNMANLNASGVISNINTVVTNLSDITNLANTLAGVDTFTITVVSSGGNKFALNGATNPTITLRRGITYTFDQSDSSNAGHPIAFRDSSNNAYTTGVTSTGTPGQAGAKTTFEVASNAPSSLKYYCTVHGNGMGNTISVVDDNIGIVAGSISNINTVAAADSNISALNASGVITNIGTVATNISGVNSFANRYRVASSAPTSSLDAGDLYFDTSTNKLNVYSGSSWATTGEAAQRSVTTHNVTSAGTQTISASYTVGLVDIYLNGLKLNISEGDATASNGTSVVVTGASIGDIIEVVALSPFNTANYGTAASKNVGIGNDNVPVFTSGAADNDFLRIDGTSIEGRSASEVLSDIGGQASLTFGIANTNAVKVDSSSVADDEYARFTANGLESRSTSEVLSDIGGLSTSVASSTYASLAGATFTGEVTVNGGINEDHNNGALTNSNQTLTLDCHNGNNFSVTTAANITSFVVSNLPPSGTAFFFTLKVTYGGSHSITWGSSIKWNAGTAPTLSTSGTDIFAFYTIDSGTTIYGFTSAQGLA